MKKLHFDWAIAGKDCYWSKDVKYPYRITTLGKQTIFHKISGGTLFASAKIQEVFKYADEYLNHNYGKKNEENSDTDNS